MHTHVHASRPVPLAQASSGAPMKAFSRRAGRSKSVLALASVSVPPKQLRVVRQLGEGSFG